jgi:plasmid stabilization system protein ParE
MDLKVVLMPSVMDDLESITRYIAENNSEAAERFGNQLIDMTAPLSRFPFLGRIVPEYETSTIREVILEPYRIIYRLIMERNEVHILRFWNSARGTPDFHYL